MTNKEKHLLAGLLEIAAEYPPPVALEDKFEGWSPDELADFLAAYNHWNRSARLDMEGIPERALMMFFASKLKGIQP